MKKQLPFLSVLIVITLLNTNALSQTIGNLWGLMPYAGDSIGGSILKYNTSTNNDSVIHSFSRDGIAPLYGNLLKANDGNLYGTTFNGGIKNNGTIYQYNPATQYYKTICYFEDTLNGKVPKAGLIQASNGNLYGITSSGGAYGKGTIYQSNLNGDISVLYSFNPANNDGNNSHGQLIEYNDTLYGLTKDGGVYGKGTLFKISFSGVFTTLHHFGNGADGFAPWASVVYHNNTLYGTTEWGGDNNLGTVFKYDLTTNQESVLFSFVVATGSNPKGGVIVVNDTLYGTTSLRGPGTNGGSIFKCSVNGNLSVVDHFVGAYSNPESGLILINDTLYGTTPYNIGSVFKCPLIGTISTIYVFNENDGNGSRCTLLPINNTLYGFASGGGANTEGTLFSITTSASFTLLHEFGNNTLGYAPFSGLFQASDGNMYGMNSAGGNFGFGTIFKVTPSGSVSTIYHFKNLENGRPIYGSLIEVNDTLYGVTTYGGDFGQGTIFKCSFSGHHQVMYSFGTITDDGNTPFSRLLAVNDTLYGTNYLGGVYGYGNIFKISLSGNYSVLANLGGAAGTPSYPTGGFTLINDTLYGLSQYGGANDKGSIYKCSLDGNVQTLHSFGVSTNDGYLPFADLAYASDGNLYGTTSAGGVNDLGTIFKCSLAGTESIVYDFKSTDGIYPNSGLIQASDSSLYGISGYFNNNNYGKLYKCSLNGNYTNLVSFKESTGYSGQPSSNLIEYMTVGVSKTTNCNGDSLVANVVGGGLDYKFKWSTGETTPKIKITSSGNYSVTVTKANGVIAKKEVNANFIAPLTLSVSNSDTICSTSTIQISANASNGNGNYTYSWIPGSLLGDTQSVTPSATTVYTVTASDALGCTKQDSVKIAVEICTGVNELSQNDMFSVFPNPSSGEFVIQLNNKRNTIYALTVKNMLGEVVNSSTLTDAMKVLDLKQLSNGTYFLSIESSESIITKRISIQR